jgi:hypothetical protein
MLWLSEFPALVGPVSVHGSREARVFVWNPDPAQVLHKLKFRPAPHQFTDIWLIALNFTTGKLLSWSHLGLLLLRHTRA